MMVSLRLLVIAAVLFLTGGLELNVLAELARPGAEMLAVVETVDVREQRAGQDPETVAPWQREEILRQVHGHRGKGGDVSMESVMMVAVPLLLFIGLFAIVRLRDF